MLEGPRIFLRKYSVELHALKTHETKDIYALILSNNMRVDCLF